MSWQAENSKRCFELLMLLAKENWLRNRKPGESADEYTRRVGAGRYLGR